MREEESLENIKQYYVKCKNEEGKYNAIQNIYGCISVGQAIIFCHVSISMKPIEYFLNRSLFKIKISFIPSIHKS